MTPSWIEPATVWFVAQYLNHCATAVPNLMFTVYNMLTALFVCVCCCAVYEFFLVTNCYARRTRAYAESSEYIKSTHSCSLIMKIYTEDTVHICHHKATQNSYKYKLLAPPSTQRIRNKNTNSVPNSVCHILWLKMKYMYVYIHFLILTQSKLSVMLSCINFNCIFMSYLHTTLVIS
jgi:hypothetical protein